MAHDHSTSRLQITDMNRSLMCMRSWRICLQARHISKVSDYLIQFSKSKIRSWNEVVHAPVTSFLSIVLNVIVSFCLAENICLPVDNQGQALCFAPLTIPMQKDLGQTSRI